MARLLLLLIVVLVAAWWLVGRHRRVQAADDARAKRGARRDAEEMIQCAHCGVHLPRGDAVVDGAHGYCSDAHRLAGPRTR